MIGLLESPYKFFENSFWIKGILEKAQQDGVGVLLTGARGNYSISWGPAMDYYAKLLRKLRWFRFYRELKHYGRHMNIGRSRLLPIIGKQAFPYATRSFYSRRPKNEIPHVIHPDLAARTNVFEKLKHHDVGLEGTSFDEFEARDYQFGNLATSNHQGTSITKFSLRYCVWERDPTADPRVVRFCLSVPIEQYVQNGMDRSLVRRATEIVFARRHTVKPTSPRRPRSGLDSSHDSDMALLYRRAAEALPRSCRLALLERGADQGIARENRPCPQAGVRLRYGCQVIDAGLNCLPVPPAIPVSELYERR